MQHKLDAGETDAIRLAISLGASKILLDERLGREAERELNLRVTGVLGELLHAKKTGTLPSVRLEIERLRSEVRFFIAKPVEMLILQEAGES